MTDKELVYAAVEAMKNSYSPYSSFCVGSALLTSGGKLYTGCNIENASFSATVCAERTALYNALTNKETNFLKIAIVGGKNKIITDYCYPCGICRQVMSEFCSNSFEILLFNGSQIKKLTLGELLPCSFNLEEICE